jgi:hypothetical protein
MSGRCQYFRRIPSFEGPMRQIFFIIIHLHKAPENDRWVLSPIVHLGHSPQSGENWGAAYIIQFTSVSIHKHRTLTLGSGSMLWSLPTFSLPPYFSLAPIHNLVHWIPLLPPPALDQFSTISCWLVARIKDQTGPLIRAQHFGKAWKKSQEDLVQYCWVWP